ncbi:GNAT family N-acetyltransferase [Bacillus sp. JJ664]
MEIRPATLLDLKEIMYIEEEVIKSNCREAEIRKSIIQNRCIVSCVDEMISGFLIYHQHFFGQFFVELVIVSPRKRRNGVAKSLLRYIEENCQTSKIFSSTNQSNQPMQEVFKTLDYVESGVIHNLDEDDPEIIYVRFNN